MFSSPTSKLRLSSVTQILDSFDLHKTTPNQAFDDKDIAHSHKDSIDSVIKLGWKTSENDLLLDTRSKRLGAVLS